MADQMTKETFEKFFKNSKMRVEWDYSLTGIAVDFTEDGYVVLKTAEGNECAFPLEQLEFVD